MSRPYCFLLTLAAVAVNYLDCDADDVSRRGTPGSSHVRHRDVMTPASCQQQLSDDIESCSSVYVRLLVSSAALDTKPGQLHHPVARRLCREYYETLQCIHDSLRKCSADEMHLYLIASRVGHVRTFMEQTCAAVDWRPTTAAVRRYPPPEVTSKHRDDVIGLTGHVTPASEKWTTVPATRLVPDKSDSSECGGTTPAAPRYRSLRSSAASSTVTPSTWLSVWLTLAVLSAILRRHSPA